MYVHLFKKRRSYFLDNISWASNIMGRYFLDMCRMKIFDSLEDYFQRWKYNVPETFPLR